MYCYGNKKLVGLSPVGEAGAMPQQLAVLIMHKWLEALFVPLTVGAEESHELDPTQCLGVVPTL
jgi:hypothetical protein